MIGLLERIRDGSWIGRGALAGYVLIPSSRPIEYRRQRGVLKTAAPTYILVSPDGVRSEHDSPTDACKAALAAKERQP